MIWPGTILPYYGAMFVLAAGLFTLRTRWVVAVGAGRRARRRRHRLVAARAAARRATTRRGCSRPAVGSPRGLLFDVAVNGTHPLLPWLAFFCAGIVLGRVLATDWWRPAAIGGGLTLFGAGDDDLGVAPATGPRGARAGEHRPVRPRACSYTASALGHGARRLRRDLVAGRPLRRHARRSSCCATPAR